MTDLNLTELRRLLADPDACGEYLVPGDGPSRLEVAAVEALEPLLDLVDKMGRALEAIPRQMRRPKLTAIIRDYRRVKESASQ